jgi:signal recognition particle receptor subunit beta
MPSINYAFKEITCKIVYYGPGAGGKTTNLQYVHGNVPAKHRGELVSLATEQDRTLFFDFLPLDIGDVKGFKTKFQLYTVPGQVYYNATRKLVLRGVDGIVFVADSQASRFQDSIDSLRNLEENLRDYGLDLETIPFVMQYNKRDLPDAVPLEELRQALNPEGKYADYEATATDGMGCRESLRDVAGQVLKKLNATANIVSDEQVVTERLGVAITPGDSSAAGAPVSHTDRRAPELTIDQETGFVWNGIKVGSGDVRLDSRKNERGEVEYTLVSKHRVLGVSKVLNRVMRYVGEDKQSVDGLERTYHVLRDSTGGSGSKRVAAYVEKGQGMDRLYLIYPGVAGDMKASPASGQSRWNRWSGLSRQWKRICITRWKKRLVH